MLVVAVVVVAVVVVSIAGVRSDRSGSSEPADRGTADRETGSSDGGILPQEELLSSYRVVYDVEEFDTPGRTEERLVKRPYLSRVVSVRDGVLLTGSITNADGRWVLLPEHGQWQLRFPGRQRPADDLRPIQALEAATDEGLAERRGTDVVLERRCTVVRTGGLPGGGLEEPSASDHIDLCIDATGVVLRERWVVRGRQARLMQATEFVPDADLDEADFAPQPAAPPLPQEAVVEKVRPLGHGESPPLPVRGVSGFEPDGGAVVVERSLPGRPPELHYEQLFVDGPRLVVVEQRTAGPGFRPRGAEIELANGGRGHLALGLVSSTLTVVTGPATYVTIRGADLDALRAFGADLVQGLA